MRNRDWLDWTAAAFLLLVLAAQIGFLFRPLRVTSDQVVSLIAQREAQLILAQAGNQQLHQRVLELEKQLADAKKLEGK